MLTFASTVDNAADAVASRTAAIHREVLCASRFITDRNFTRIGTEDLERLFDLYDAHFFDGRLRGLVDQQAHGALSFRLSNRMTRVGGTTTRYNRPRCPHCGCADAVSYEIAISSALLFQTFRGESRPIVINGIQCTDRLGALQRVFEHELIHLVEMLVWGESSCSAPRFQDLARRTFGHTGVTHSLVTSTETTMTRFGIRPGDRVAFEFEGTRWRGVVNRVHKRATVLVECERGTPYSDGRRYRKFYVPPSLLEREDAASSKRWAASPG